MLRITTKTSASVTVIRIDGRLGKEGVMELDELCRSIEGPLCLDLANLEFVDSYGAKLITDIEARGAAITGASPYIERVLEVASHH